MSDDSITGFCRFLFYLPYYIYLLSSSIFKSTAKKLSQKRKDLKNETILVTGSASGLGQHLVWKLAKQFPTAVYVLWDVNEQGLQKTRETCKKLGASKVYTNVVDLCKREQIIKAAAQVRNQVGPVTVLINNAGVARNSLFLESDMVFIEKEITVNLLSYMWTIREFLPDMVQSGKGHVVSTCSGLGFFRLLGGSGYVSSKYGLRGFLETLKLELRQHPDKPNIAISTIYPAFVKTPMVEENLSFTARYKSLEVMDVDIATEEIVDGILKEKEEIMVPGSLKWLDVLYRILPTQFIDDMEAHLIQNFKLKKTT